MDVKDQKILAILQADASVSMVALAEQASLSPTACWNRVQRLRKDGVITRQVCLLDSKKLGLGVTVFVAIKTSCHDTQWMEQFTSGVRDMSEVVEFYRMSGEIDYLLKVVVPDIQGFDRVYKRLIKTASLFDVSSSFSMEELKYTTEMPLDYC